MADELTVAPDPFGTEPTTLAEFSAYREKGELPERFKPAEPPATEKVETDDGKEPPKTEQEKAQERDDQGKFKAKEPLFDEAQQKAFDRAFAKREAKLRREYDERIAALESSTIRPTPAAKEATPAAPSEPTPPEIPNLVTFKGTAEEYDKLLNEYPKKLEAYLDAQRSVKEKQQTLQQKITQSEAKTKQAHPDYESEFNKLLEDVKDGEEPGLPDYLLKTIAEETDDPHAIAYHLAKNREEYKRLVSLSPAQALREVIKLEIKLGTPAPAPEVKPAPKAAEKFTPPEPVGARATSKAFDVNDESMSAEEWARKRNEQLSKRG